MQATRKLPVTPEFGIDADDNVHIAGIPVRRRTSSTGRSDLIVDWDVRGGDWRVDVGERRVPVRGRIQLYAEARDLERAEDGWIPRPRPTGDDQPCPSWHIAHGRAEFHHLPQVWELSQSEKSRVFVKAEVASLGWRVILDSVETPVKGWITLYIPIKYLG